MSAKSKFSFSKFEFSSAEENQGSNFDAVLFYQKASKSQEKKGGRDKGERIIQQKQGIVSRNLAYLKNESIKNGEEMLYEKSAAYLSAVKKNLFSKERQINSTCLCQGTEKKDPLGGGLG